MAPSIEDLEQSDLKREVAFGDKLIPSTPRASLIEGNLYEVTMIDPKNQMVELKEIIGSELTTSTIQVHKKHDYWRTTIPTEVEK